MELEPLILIDNTLAVLSDRGELSLVNASPSGFNEMAIFKSLAERTTGHLQLMRTEECIAVQVPVNGYAYL